MEHERVDIGANSVTMNGTRCALRPEMLPLFYTARQEAFLAKPGRHGSQ